MSVGTPFHPRTSELNRKMQWREWSGYFASSCYADFHDIEYNAIREQAALIDVSPLCKYRVTGRDALALVDRVITRDATRMTIGQVAYTPWCDDDGNLVDDELGTAVREHRLLNATIGSDTVASAAGRAASPDGVNSHGRPLKRSGRACSSPLVRRRGPVTTPCRRPTRTPWCFRRHPAVAVQFTRQSRWTSIQPTGNSRWLHAHRQLCLNDRSFFNTQLIVDFSHATFSPEFVALGV